MADRKAIRSPSSVESYIAWEVNEEVNHLYIARPGISTILQGLGNVKLHAICKLCTSSTFSLYFLFTFPFGRYLPDSLKYSSVSEDTVQCSQYISCVHAVVVGIVRVAFFYLAQEARETDLAQ